MKSFKIKNRVLFWSLFSAFTLFVICYLYFSLDGIWMFFNVPFMNPIFADLINVTHAHLALEAGLDPIFSNPFDPWCRPMPYPRIWLYLRHFFFTCENTVYIAFLQMFFFLCSVYSLLRDVNVKYSWVCLIFIFSPSVLFCVERGNVDLTIFSLLMLCLKNINKSRVWSSLFLLFSSLLKIYPIFAILVLFKSGLKSSIKSIWPILFIFIVYFSLVFDDLIQINKIVNFSQDVGFGLKPLVYFLTNLKFKWTMIFVVLNIFILFLFYRFVFRLNYRRLVRFENQYLLAFVAGSSLYIGMYFLGVNHNYKLIFLLFCIPFLLSEVNSVCPRLYFWLIFIVALALWYPFFNKIIGLLSLPGFTHSLVRLTEHTIHFNLVCIFILFVVLFVDNCFRKTLI